MGWSGRSSRPFRMIHQELAPHARRDSRARRRAVRPGTRGAHDSPRSPISAARCPSIRASRIVSGTARTSARSARRWIFQAGIGSSDHMSSEETSAAPTLKSRRPASASDRNAERNDPLTWSTAEEARRSGRPRHPSGRAQSRTESTGEVADTRAPGRPCLAPTRIGEKAYTSHQRSTA